MNTNDYVAIEELKRLSMFDIEPTIDEADLETILVNAQVCSLWVPSKAYSYGDVVVPTTNNQNGHRYKCIRSGTSLSIEPTWNEFQCGRVFEGTLIWEEAGAQPRSLWDMRAATYNAWLFKASKIAPDFDFSGAAESYKRSQAYDNCLEQARKYAPARIA